ncbi:MAG: hypothetical protein EBX37_02050 [Alphaproteobacteria bacterium]|nr:hypothetical protein [Alphaproteobacteria bacterium]
MGIAGLPEQRLQPGGIAALETARGEDNAATTPAEHGEFQRGGTARQQHASQPQPGSGQHAP